MDKTSKKSARQEQKEHTHQMLLQTAYSVFAQKGILAAKTVDIANAAGVSHGSLFSHFKTRDELLMCVIDAFGCRMGEEFRKLNARAGGVKDILEGHLAILREFECFYAQLVIEGPLLPKEIRNAIFLIQSGVAHYLEEAAKRDLKKKLIRPIPLPLLLNTWLGILHYYLANRDLFAPGGYVLKLRGKELLNHFIKLIQNKGDHS